MYKYALTEPSSYYLGQFHEESIKIKPGLHRPDGKSWHNGEQHGSCKCGDFWIVFDGIKTAVPPEMIATVKAVLGNIVEMDRTARSIVKAEGDYEEALTYIKIKEACVELHYPQW